MWPQRENSNKLLAIIISRPLIETEENFNTKPISIWAKLCGLLFVFCFSSAVLAEDCFRGTLNKQYCDRDHDLVADLPLDPAVWANPDTIIFSYAPVEDPAIYAKVWDGFINHMSKVTGKKVVFFPVQSYAAQYEAMRSGRLHIAGVNTGGNPVAVSCAGLVPFAMMASKDGSYGYETEIIVPKGSAIKSPADIKGRTLAFTSPTSNSGNKAPSALLKSEFGLVKDVDFKTVFSGKHDNSVLGIANKDYEVAATANSVIALDFYFKNRESPPGKTSDEIQTLSNEISSVGNALCQR